MTDQPPPPDPLRTQAGRPRRKAARKLRPRAVTAAMLADAPDFAPVPRAAARHDGWTAERQRAFVAALAECGSVHRACTWLGMSTVGAYLLRRAAGADAFRAAWDEALVLGVARLADAALDRALNGVAQPVFYKGEVVGERRFYNDRLLMWVLRHRDPEGWERPMGNRVPPHVRRALRAEWEAERAAESAGARAALAAKLDRIAERLAREDAAEREGGGERDRGEAR